MKWFRGPPRPPADIPPADTLRGERLAVFIEKDDTLVDDGANNPNPALPGFTPHALEGLRLLRGAGFALVIVTHQPVIAQQRFTRQAFARLEAALLARLAAEGIAVEGSHLCPHEAGPGGACLCRKPAAGLLRQAAIAHRLHLPGSWMIGDTLDDVEAGHRAGCRSVLLDVGNETGWRQSPLRVPDHRCADLLAAAQFILAAAPRPERCGAPARIPGLPSRLGLSSLAAVRGNSP